MILAETFASPIDDTRHRDESGDVAGVVRWKYIDGPRVITAVWRPSCETFTVRTPGGVYCVPCDAHPKARPDIVIRMVQAAFSTAFKS